MVKPSVIIPSEQQASDWIEKNIYTLMGQVMTNARRQKPLPLSIAMHPVAYRKFVQILSSKSGYFPETDGSFKFIGVPVFRNTKLPFGTFTLERIRNGSGMLVR